MIAGKVVGLGFEIISKLDSFFFNDSMENEKMIEDKKSLEIVHNTSLINCQSH